MGLTLFGSNHIWVLPYLGRTIFGSYRIWVLPYLGLTIFGSYRMWVLPYLSLVDLISSLLRLLSPLSFRFYGKIQISSSTLEQPHVLMEASRGYKDGSIGRS